MLHLVQAVSRSSGWDEVCDGLIGSLSSEEGSVTEEYTLGENETPRGSQVLTFNAADQAGIEKCGSQMKVMAIESRLLSSANHLDLLSVKASIEDSTTKILGSSEVLQAVVDGPWATDACNDIAHGFLTARLAHPEVKKKDFCLMYKHDLEQLRGAKKVPHARQAAVQPQTRKTKLPSDAQHAAEDLAKLKKRGAKKVLEKHQKAADVAEATHASSSFLRDAALSNVQNAGAVDWELGHPAAGAGDDLWSQVRAASAGQADAGVVAATSLGAAPPRREQQQPAHQERPKEQAKAPVKLGTAPQPPARQEQPKAQAAKPVAALVGSKTSTEQGVATEADDDASNEGGAEFWQEMFQR